MFFLMNRPACATSYIPYKFFVIPTEAEPSGGIWLRTKSKFSQNPDVSTEPVLSAVERARHGNTAHIRYAISNTTQNTCLSAFTPEIGEADISPGKSAVK